MASILRFLDSMEYSKAHLYIYLYISVVYQLSAQITKTYTKSNFLYKWSLYIKVIFSDHFGKEENLKNLRYLWILIKMFIKPNQNTHSPKIQCALSVFPVGFSFFNMTGEKEQFMPAVNFQVEINVNVC